MNAIKRFAFFLVIAAASGNVVEHRQRLIDPWGKAREICREKCGFTAEQLKVEGDEDLRNVKDVLLCMGNELRNLNKDGSPSKKRFLPSITRMCPLVIAEPIFSCCNARVYEGESVNADNAAILLAEFGNCWKSLVPSSMWNVIGVVAPPVYPQLEKCQGC